MECSWGDQREGLRTRRLIPRLTGRVPNCEVHFAMTELLEACFAGTNVVPTVLLGLVLLYWLLVLIGALALDAFDFDLDMDADVGGDIDVDGDLDIDVAEPGAFASVLSLGVVVLRFMNIGRVPLMVWLSVFALALWLSTMALDKPQNHATLAQDLLILLRNGVIAVACAKIITQPLRGKFDVVEAPRVRDLMGRECTVVTPTLNEQSGQSRCATEGAPRLLNARTRSEPLAKGDRAVIIEIDLAQGIYFVEKAEQEVQS